MTWAAIVVGVAVILVEAVLVVQSLRPSGPLTADGVDRDRDTVRAEPVAGLPRVGTVVETRISSSGGLSVRQWIRPRDPVRRIRIGSSPVPGTSSPPTATSILVAGDGRVLYRDGAVGVQGRVYRFPRPVGVVYVSYRLAGALDLRGSVRGRALLREASLDLYYGPEPAPVRVSVIGEGVLSMACSAREDPPGLAVPCGESDGDGWTVTLAGDRTSDRVMAQVDLGTDAATAAGAAAPGRTP